MIIKEKLKRKNVINTFLEVKSIENIDIIDLRSIKEADIFGCITLILVIKNLYNRNSNKISIILPKSNRVSKYLHICGFVQMLEKEVDFKYNAIALFTKVSPSKVNIDKGYIPIQLIKNREDAETVIQSIRVWMESIEYKFKKEIMLLITELIGNCIDHSEASENIFFGMQKIPKGEKSHLMISIADLGVGINDSLKENPKYTNRFFNNLDALEYIFKNEKFITSETEDEETRGNGFKSLNDTCKKIKMAFIIYSRESIYRVYFRNGKKIVEKHNTFDINGTHINILLNL